MAAQPIPQSSKVPAHAWAWLQRSRPVLNEIVTQLYGQPPETGLMDRLQADYAADPFVQDLVARVVCDVAFGGRVRDRRPAGARWDRGLTWWAAHLAGMTIKEFDDRSRPADPPQARLFGAQPSAAPGAGPAVPADGGPPRRRPLVSVERRAMIQALRDMLAMGDGDSVPASAVRSLIESLSEDDR